MRQYIKFWFEKIELDKGKLSLFRIIIAANKSRGRTYLLPGGLS